MDLHDRMHTMGLARTTEWWYFDFLLEDGTKVVLSLFTKYYFNSLTEGLSPKMHICVLDAEGHLHAQSIHNTRRLPFSLAEDRVEYVVDRSYIRREEDAYRCHFEEGGIVFDAQITGTFVNTLETFAQTGRDAFFWNVTIPCGRAVATLKLGNNTHTLGGIAYHDHNWSTAPLNELMRDWKWMRFSAAGTTYVLFDITKADGTVVRRGYSFADGAMAVYEDIETEEPMALSDTFGYYRRIRIADHTFRIQAVTPFIQGSIDSKIKLPMGPFRPAAEAYVLRKVGARAYQRHAMRVTVDGIDGGGNIEFIELR